MTRQARLVGAVVALTFVVIAIGMLRAATNGHPMSVVDEHTHLDTAFKVHDGTYPYRGATYSQQLVEEWACGVGHDGGATLAPCDHPDLGPISLPSGRLTSGYIHYPTYFLLAEGFRTVVDPVTDLEPVATYRLFSSLTVLLGVATCALVGWRLGLRGSALLAATTLPSAASSLLMYGEAFNPMSLTVAVSAVFAGFALTWVRTGRGYWGVVMATALAAGLSVTTSLPAGGMILTILAAVALKARGRPVQGPWQPRLWHAGLLGVVLVTPIVVFNRVIESRATVDNSELYSFSPVNGAGAIAVGFVGELVSLHTPWINGDSLRVTSGHLVPELLRAAVVGLPLLLTITVFGGLVLLLARGPQDDADPQVGALTPAERLLTLGTLVGLMLYAPLLRVSNAMTFGFDFPIVSRYSTAFAPLLVLLLLAGIRSGTVMRVLAAAGTVSLVGLSMAGY